ncbi:FAD-binding oxidoreductase [Natronorubrum tibetense]|uniref:FAD linked oxidase n=1 Tax=Natronorubrum tibetense GA33 TaxID=1114856 RepID=L9VX03_9EURY|nr:FAD-binding oxidoreductase [Natronorubrum tibetense]ELY41527.1 FAD linked oxidase [Natronorubrum tibetense GA33]
MSSTPRGRWGWGFENELIDEDGLRDRKAFLESVLDFPERPVLEPTPIAEATIPEPEIEAPDHLDSFCTSNRAVRARRTYGMAPPENIRAFHGDFSPAPDVVAQPRTETDVEDVLEWATDRRVAVTPVTGGTGVAGGTSPPAGENRADYAGTVALDLRNLNDVLEVDEQSRTALIEGGTMGPDINDQLEAHGLHLRHYPQSYELSGLGGWIATRSGGHYATRYTHIDELVESVRMICPAGAFETQRLPAHGAGPDANRLVCGSEGSLGVITRAWMQVEPRPRYRSEAAVYFDGVLKAAAAIRRIVQAKLYPANCRLHDRVETTMYGLEDVDRDMVVLGFESTDGPTEGAIERALEICEEAGGDCPDGPDHHGEGYGCSRSPDSDVVRWGRAFQMGGAGNAAIPLCVVRGTVETAVTWDRFPAFHEAMLAAFDEVLEPECGMGHVSTRFSHVYPDGPAVYYTFQAPGDADPDRRIEQWRRIKRAGLDTVMEYDLTPTHHHAVGRNHREWYAEQIPENYGESLRAVKGVLDPAGVMNPGVLVDAPEEE